MLISERKWKFGCGWRAGSVSEFPSASNLGDIRTEYSRVEVFGGVLEPAFPMAES